MPHYKDTLWNYIEETLIYGESNSHFFNQGPSQEYEVSNSVEYHELIQFVENSLWSHPTGTVTRQNLWKKINI